MILAVTAVPGVVLLQDLGLLGEFQALRQGVRLVYVLTLLLVFVHGGWGRTYVVP
jgi:hypothetical protein